MKYAEYLLLCICCVTNAYALPAGFVYLHEIDPSILQEIRYAGSHNFVGRPIEGYEKGTCILTEKAAHALAMAQKALRQTSMSLKVYDCYRPTQAVEDFMHWSQDATYQEMKPEFYPRVNKIDLFKLGYIATKSGHSRGSTLDLTIVSIPAAKQKYDSGPLVACTAPYRQRFPDNSIDMGTGYDCMDEESSIENQHLNASILKNRQLLQTVMIANGFEPYLKEWWHFTLSEETFPDTYFNFPVN
jgi:D-alanyl-D-alanine dipeptidase